MAELDADNRINLIVVNNTGLDLICAGILCQTFNNLKTGQILKNGETGVYTSPTNERIFVSWQPVGSDSISYQMAMTCPKSSSNSACGITPNAGLQAYERSGTPVTFKYIPGSVNLADWNYGNVNKNCIIPMGDCYKARPNPPGGTSPPGGG